MQEFFELIGLSDLSNNAMLRNRFIYASFCLLIFVILFYFWTLARNKVGAKVQSTNGLMYLALTYVLLFFIGMASLYNAPLNAFYGLSVLISMSYLLSLPFFSLGIGWVDKVVESQQWRTGIKIIGFVWLILVSWVTAPAFLKYGDIVISVISFLLLGYFIIRYFMHRRMYPLAFLGFMIFFVIIALGISPPDAMVTEGKFSDVSTVILAPGLVLSVMMLAYTFSWINELNFQELSTIWTGESDENEEKQIVASAKKNTPNNRASWEEKIADDNLERVIEEIIISKKHRNEKLELILNIASRNTRNNNNRLRDLIKYEDYQRNRNTVAHALMTMIQE